MAPCVSFFPVIHSTAWLSQGWMAGKKDTHVSHSPWLVLCQPRSGRHEQGGMDQAKSALRCPVQQAPRRLRRPDLAEQGNLPCPAAQWEARLLAFSLRALRV